MICVLLSVCEADCNELFAKSIVQDVSSCLCDGSSAPPDLLLDFIRMGLKTCLSRLANRCSLASAEKLQQGLLGTAAMHGSHEMVDTVRHPAHAALEKYIGYETHYIGLRSAMVGFAVDSSRCAGDRGTAAPPSADRPLQAWQRCQRLHSPALGRLPPGSSDDLLAVGSGGLTAAQVAGASVQALPANPERDHG